MTKRTKVKKFMEATGTDKKTAYEFLRHYGYDYESAIACYNLKPFNSARELARIIAETLENFSKALQKATTAIAKTLQEIDWSKIDWQAVAEAYLAEHQINAIEEKEGKNE